MAFEAYSVAIKLSLIDALSPAMRLLTTNVDRASGAVGDLEKRIGRVQTLMKTGALMTAAGLGITWALKSATGEAIRFEQQMNRLSALNLGSGITGELSELADKISASTKGTSRLDALRLVTETQSITADAHHTALLAPYLAKMRFGMETSMSKGGKGEGHGEKAERQFADIIKVMEMRGLMRDFTQEKLSAMGDMFVKNYVASGGMVKPSDFLNMMKTGGVAGKSVGDDFMFALGHIIQEKGGSRAGTGLMSMYQNLIAGRMPQQVAETLNKLGLLDKSAIHYGKTGHITKVDPGGLVNSQLLMSRPDLYVMQEVLPALKKAGVDINNQNQVLMKLNSLAGQRTAADLLAQLYLESGQIANHIKQAKGTMGVDALYKQASDSTVGKQAELRAKLANLELTFGETVLPLQIAVLEELIPLFEKMNLLLKENPGAVKGVVYGLAALGGALMIGGSLTMFAGGITAVSTAMTELSIAAPAATLALQGVLGVVGALAAGYGIGKLANEYVFDPIAQKLSGNKDGTVGTAIYDLFHPEEAAPSKKSGMGYSDLQRQWQNRQVVQSAAMRGNQVNLHGDVKLDGRKVGNVVASNIARQQGVGATGYGFDMGVSLPMPGNR